MQDERVVKGYIDTVRPVKVKDQQKRKNGLNWAFKFTASHNT
jgi:anaerobic ribonucleoside-triphosphate reductase